jgi:hypothetical protein
MSAEPQAEQSGPTQPKTPDLMAALKASLEAAKRKPTEQSGPTAAGTAQGERVVHRGHRPPTEPCGWWCGVPTLAAENAALREQHGMLEQQRAEAWQQAEALRGQLAEAEKPDPQLAAMNAAVRRRDAEIESLKGQLAEARGLIQKGTEQASAALELVDEAELDTDQLDISTALKTARGHIEDTLNAHVAALAALDPSGQRGGAND